VEKIKKIRGGGVKKAEKCVRLPADEHFHKGQAIEWWYFNGFLEGEGGGRGEEKAGRNGGSGKERGKGVGGCEGGGHKYSFMTCLFKAEKDKVNLSFLKLPVKTIYFSHSLLFDLTTGKVEKEVLPFVMLSEDSFKAEELKINYFYPLRTDYINYEISRFGEAMRLKTKWFDLVLDNKKPPLLEGGKGYIELPGKSTYYYSYSRMEAQGVVGKERVKGIAWHDKQWSTAGFMDDYWLWFSIQAEDGTDIVCFDYKGKKMATISYGEGDGCGIGGGHGGGGGGGVVGGGGRQKTLPVTFEPTGRAWESPGTGISYNLKWRIKVGGYVIETAPFMEDCEMRFGFINYWEGPLKVSVNGKPAKGFMEFLAKKGVSGITGMIEREVELAMGKMRKFKRFLVG
jgi:predicted secreted hydrolase